MLVRNAPGGQPRGAFGQLTRTRRAIGSKLVTTWNNSSGGHDEKREKTIMKQKFNEKRREEKDEDDDDSDGKKQQQASIVLLRSVPQEQLHLISALRTLVLRDCYRYRRYRHCQLLCQYHRPGMTRVSVVGGHVGVDFSLYCYEWGVS